MIRSKASSEHFALPLWSFHSNKLYSDRTSEEDKIKVCISMIFNDCDIYMVLNVLSLSTLSDLSSDSLYTDVFSLILRHWIGNLSLLYNITSQSIIALVSTS